MPKGVPFTAPTANGELQTVNPLAHGIRILSRTGEDKFDGSSLVGLINAPPADDRAQHPDLGVLGRRNLGEVVGKDNEVGVFAHF